MIHHWCSTEGKDLKESFIAEMLNAEIAIKFAVKVNDIIRNRYPALSDSDTWDPNDLLSIREFNHQIESAVQLLCTLKNLYKKQYDDIEIVEKACDVTANTISDTMLVKFGWVKESEGN